MASFHRTTKDTVRDTAAMWLARRDRGLSSAEQDQYLEWLGSDARHSEAIKIHEATLAHMMKISDWQPGVSSEPNPDLFAPWPVPGRAIKRWFPFPLAAGIAAVAMLAGLVFMLPTEPETRLPELSGSPYLVRSERVALEDGTLIELKEGSRLTAAYTRLERRVLLEGGEGGGEGYFTVAKDPNRPFVVEAAGVEVIALGTMFNVRIDAAEVDVLVTSGRVRVAAPPPREGASSGARIAAVLGAGERANVPLEGDAAIAGPSVISVSDEGIHRALQWQKPLFRFDETPLRVAVAEFNRHNAHQIEVSGRQLGETMIGGAFRVDNVDGFLRSVEMSLDVEAVPRGSSLTILRQRRAASP